MNFDEQFDNLCLYPNTIAQSAYQEGLIQGLKKVDQSVHEFGQQQGFNIGQLIGVIEGEIKIIKYLNKDPQILQKLHDIETAINQMNIKDVQGATKLIQIKSKLRNIKRTLGLKGGLEFKRAQNLEF